MSSPYLQSLTGTGCSRLQSAVKINCFLSLSLDVFLQPLLKKNLEMRIPTQHDQRFQHSRSELHGNQLNPRVYRSMRSLWSSKLSAATVGTPSFE